IDQLQLYGKVLICGHGYHNECFQKMGFKCHYCLDYLVDGINVYHPLTMLDWKVKLQKLSNLLSNNLNINIRAALQQANAGRTGNWFLFNTKGNPAFSVDIR
ncbi:10151_t:CDS:2, partial [Entrophospora sp. SA101]